jgi:hypothetical protein
MTFSAGIIFASTMAIGYHPLASAQAYEANHPMEWTDSIKTSRGADSFKIFAVITDVQKYLTDRRIGINIMGDRYELLYKRIY